ncbi:MAG: hypothetical protein A2142_04970 [candidate division Zixibacteria bacterium RBG_16_48_11]|nr:MAG: hypothetical protein A2142_04970 [candidate division Zixibacteria bacterium RBG_16_48_11]
MYVSWIVLGSAILVLAFIAYQKGGWLTIGNALGQGGGLFLYVLPNLLLGFALAGFLQVLLPSELIAKYLGQESGWKGLLFGAGVGCITPGGPFTHFPILAAFLTKGAGVGPVSAYIAAWALLGLQRFFVWELPILGSHFALVRFGSSLAFPVIIGWIAGQLYYRLFPSG